MIYDTQFVISALRTSNFDLFDNPEANAAAARLNEAMLFALEAGDNVKPASIPVQINFIYDSIEVAEAMIEKYTDLLGDADFMAFFQNETMIYQLIATFRQSIAQGREQAVALRNKMILRVQ